MRRLGARLAAVALLLGLLPLTAGACNISCACTTPPTHPPGWTPPPVSTNEAVVAAAAFAAGTTGAHPSGLQASPTYSSEGHPAYTVVSPTVDAVVEAQTGLVVEFVLMDALPDSSDVAISSADALARATAFLGDRSRDTGILVATTTLQGGATSAYIVTWADQSGGAGQISVSVNPSSGTVFAFVDQRFGVQFVPPSIGAAAAGRLALAAVSMPGALVLAKDFDFGLGDATWQVSLGVPSTTESDVYVHGAAVEVDAVTGAVTIEKSS
jgi:hypothetical protein